MVSKISKQRLSEIFRVDHAGEIAAQAIYAGQALVFSQSSKTANAHNLVREMGKAEQPHLDYFSQHIHDGTRPTALMPFSQIAGFGLGVASALMGEKAAHACTEAVEEVIAQHYFDQADELKEAGETELANTLAQFGIEEQGHQETAIHEGSQDVAAHTLLTTFVKTGCKIAIKLTEKI